MFLKRGGRLSGAAAMAGTLLGIKPVCTSTTTANWSMEKVRPEGQPGRPGQDFQAIASDPTGGTVYRHGDCPNDCQYGWTSCARWASPTARDGKFLSKDDLRNRTKISKTVIDLMDELNLLGDIPDSNQISIFDFKG